MVSSSIPQEHLASSTTPIRERYRFSLQCPVLAWIRIDACSDVNAPYSRSVCLPGRAWSSFQVYWPGRPSRSSWSESRLRSCSIDLINPAASRTRRASGAVSPPAWLAAALAAASACSLPQTPECPGTHLSSTSISFSCSAKKDSEILRRGSLPLFVLFPALIASRASWLSERIVIRNLVAKSGSSCGSGSNDSHYYAQRNPT
jgi:hypothetical protein